LVAEDENGNLMGYAYAGAFKGRAAYDWAVETSIYVKQGEAGQGIGKLLFHEIQSRLPHNRAWLCTCQQIRPPYEFYLGEGFKPYQSEEVRPGLTWAYLEK